MQKFLTYQKFQAEEDAQPLIDLLEENNIHYLLEHDREVLDKVYIGNNLDPLFCVNIGAEDFEKVNGLLKEQAKQEVGNLDPGYYLFHFSNEELLEVVTNKNEWNAFDQGVAEQLLEDKMVTVTPDVKLSSETSVVQSSKVEGLYLFIQYLLSVLIPFAGIIIGVATINAYRTTATGQRVKMYDTQSREHAKLLVAIGIARTMYTFYYFYLRD